MLTRLRILVLEKTLYRTMRYRTLILHENSLPRILNPIAIRHVGQLVDMSRGRVEFASEYQSHGAFLEDVADQVELFVPSNPTKTLMEEAGRELGRGVWSAAAADR